MEAVQPVTEAAPAAAVKSVAGRKTGIARNGRKKVLSGTSWTANSARCVQDCVIAARNGGGGNVSVEQRPDGSNIITIDVKQSRDCEPPLVVETRNLRLQDVAAQRLRQQRTLD